MDPTHDAAVDVFSAADTHIARASQSQRTYSHIPASRSSRIHNGDIYHVTYQQYAGRDPLHTLSDRACQTAANEDFVQSSQKRKRSVGDTEEETQSGRQGQTGGFERLRKVVTVQEGLAPSRRRSDYSHH